MRPAKRCHQLGSARLRAHLSPFAEIPLLQHQELTEAPNLRPLDSYQKMSQANMKQHQQAAHRQAPDLRARIRLLQGKLHPSASSNSNQDEDALSVASIGSLASCSSQASSSDSSSSPPTPPPRLSSLRRELPTSFSHPQPDSSVGETQSSSHAKPMLLLSTLQADTNLQPTPPIAARSSQALARSSPDGLTVVESPPLHAPAATSHLHQHKTHANQSLLDQQPGCLASLGLPRRPFQPIQAGQLARPIQPTGQTKSTTLVHNYLPQASDALLKTSPPSSSSSASHQLSLKATRSGGLMAPSRPLPPPRPVPEFGFADPSRTPLTKAVQNMVNQRQQQQHQQQQQQQPLATIVINRPSSRYPIHGYALTGGQQHLNLGLPLVQPTSQQRLGSTCSASMTSISSVSTHSSSGQQPSSESPVVDSSISQGSHGMRAEENHAQVSRLSHSISRPPPLRLELFPVRQVAPRASFRAGAPMRARRPIDWPAARVARRQASWMRRQLATKLRAIES